MTVAGKGGAGPAGLLWLILCCLDQAQRRHVNTECCQWALFSEAQYVPDVRILTASSHCDSFAQKRRTFLNFAQGLSVFRAGPPGLSWPCSCGPFGSLLGLECCVLQGSPCGPTSCHVLSALSPFWAFMVKAILFFFSFWLACSTKRSFYTIDSLGVFSDHHSLMTPSGPRMGQHPFTVFTAS